MIEALTGFDAALFFLINGTHHPVADWFFRIITWLGSGWIIAPLLIGIIVVKLPRAHLRRALICGVVGLTLSGVINSQIKRTVNRPRPAVFFAQDRSRADIVADDLRSVKPMKEVRLLGPDYNSWSFPSGHTNTAFGAAAFLVLLFGGWLYGSFVIALLVGYSRVYLGVHFPLDAAAGALLGTGIMWIVFFLSGCVRKYRLPGGKSC